MPSIRHVGVLTSTTHLFLNVDRYRADPTSTADRFACNRRRGDSRNHDSKANAMYLLKRIVFRGCVINHQHRQSARHAFQHDIAVYHHRDIYSVTLLSEKRIRRKHIDFDKETSFEQLQSIMIDMVFVLEEKNTQKMPRESHQERCYAMCSRNNHRWPLRVKKKQIKKDRYGEKLERIVQGYGV